MIENIFVFESTRMPNCGRNDDPPIPIPLRGTICISHWSRTMAGVSQAQSRWLKMPPVDLKDCTDPALMPSVVHVDSCDDCNEI
jgi:hypothetical protein